MNHVSSKLIAGICAFVAIGCMAAANAAVINPNPATSTSTTFHASSRVFAEALNGEGLSGGGTSGDILTETHAAAGSEDHWLSAAGVASGGISTTEVLTFDLNGSFNVDTIYLWDYNRPERARGIKTFDIAFSTNGGSTFGPAVSAASLGMADFTIGATGGSSSVQTRSITAQSGVTHIRFTNIQNFNTDRLAISEIRFGGVIPEPASLALVGLGGLVMLRRRK